MNTVKMLFLIYLFISTVHWLHKYIFDMFSRNDEEYDIKAILIGGVTIIQKTQV